MLATTGDTHFGSEDFDNHVIDYLAQQYKKTMGTDVSIDTCHRQVEARDQDGQVHSVYPTVDFY